jgi:Protein of unknown function (DUF3574)
LAVTAPNTPTTTTQPRKKTFTPRLPAHSAQMFGRQRSELSFEQAATIIALTKVPGYAGKPEKGELFSRTELFFGLSRSNGPDVTEEEFQHFVDTEVTPRFPDGLTLLTGTGQFKDSTGTIIQEGSKLLILLYPFNQKSNRAVEQIREAYKDTFQQESVLRVDEQSCVSF